MKTAKVEGLALALIANSEPVYIKAYGLADVESHRPLTTRTVMYAASLTKAAFATMVLQLVVEAVTGKSAGDLMQARIFVPFGMTRTSMTWRADFRIDFAHGYEPDGTMVGHHMWRKAGAAGSMDTTISDFAKFLAAVEGGALLSPRAQSEMLRPQVAIHTKTEFPVLRPEIPGQNEDIALSYGLGWGLFRTPFGEAFFKEGHDAGTSNCALCLKDRGLCILMLSNDNRAEGIFKYMVDKLVGDVHLPWRWEGYVPYDRRKAP